MNSLLPYVMLYELSNQAHRFNDSILDDGSPNIRTYGSKMTARHSPGQWKELKKQPKIARNTPCPCGSGKKYKKCCAIA